MENTAAHILCKISRYKIRKLKDDLVHSFYLFEDVMAHPREQEVNEYKKSKENNKDETGNVYSVALPREQEVNKNIDNTKNIKNQICNEQNAENKLIFNGLAWEIYCELA